MDWFRHCYEFIQWSTGVLVGKSLLDTAYNSELPKGLAARSLDFREFWCFNPLPATDFGC